MDENDFMQWLEECIRPAMERRPLNMCVVICWDNQTYTGYLNADAQEMAMMANHIQSDDILELIRVNADRIKDILEGTEDD